MASRFLQFRCLLWHPAFQEFRKRWEAKKMERKETAGDGGMGGQADEWEEDGRFSFFVVKLNKMNPPRIFYLSSDKNNEQSFIF